MREEEKHKNQTGAHESRTSAKYETPEMGHPTLQIMSTKDAGIWHASKIGDFRKDNSEAPRLDHLGAVIVKSQRLLSNGYV